MCTNKVNRVHFNYKCTLKKPNSSHFVISSYEMAYSYDFVRCEQNHIVK